MGRIIKVLAMPLMLFSVLASASGFKIDVPYMEAVKAFGSLNVGSLGVGETGIVSNYNMDICLDDHILKIGSATSLANEINEYSLYFEVTRRPNQSVSVVFSKKGRTPDADSVENAVMSIASSYDCNELNEIGVPLFTVTTFLGANSLKDLLPKTEKTIKIEPNKSEPDSASSKWSVSESKSPIDDSPMVTMSKAAEVGDDRLVLRCKEDSTTAYILTDEYLTEDSTNITIRYDAEEAKKLKLLLSTNNKALFFSPAISNIKKMVQSKTVVIRYKTYSNTTNTVSFKIEDLKKKIELLSTACNW